VEAENKRLINIAGDALGLSPYQRNQDTVEVLANHARRLGEEIAKLHDERNALLNTIRDLQDQLLVKINKIGELRKLLQEHQTYQTKQGNKEVFANKQTKS